MLLIDHTDTMAHKEGGIEQTIFEGSFLQSQLSEMAVEEGYRYNCRCVYVYS